MGLVVVGSLLVSDLERSPAHAVVGGIAGYAFGAYRARTTYVSAVPAHKGVILRYSLESFAALGLLIVISSWPSRTCCPPATSSASSSPHSSASCSSSHSPA